MLVAGSLVWLFLAMLIGVADIVSRPQFSAARYAQDDQWVATPEAIQFVSVDPPPSEIPRLSLKSSKGSLRASTVQFGELVTWRWVVDGQPTIAMFDETLRWPSAVQIRGRAGSLRIDTDSLPFFITIGFYDGIDQFGMPLGDPLQVRCELDGSPSDCIIEHADNRTATDVHFEYPAELGEYYIAVYAAWIVDAETVTASTPAVDWPVYEAGWLFHVVPNK